MEKVVEKMIKQLQERLKDKKVTIKLTPEAKSFLANKGYNQSLGARPIQRLIDSTIAEKLSQEILFGSLSSGGKVIIKIKDEEILFVFQN